MAMYKRCIFTLIILLALLITRSFGQLSEGFTASLDGWWTVGDPGSGPSPSWVASGGNPGGCEKGTDESIGTWYFLGSSVFKGDLSSYYGCYLTFDLKQNTNTWQFDDKDVVIIRNDDQALVYDTPYNPGMTWTSYSVPLSYGAGWKWNTLGGTTATAADIANFLSNVKRIRIRAEYSGLTYETDYLDNVNISCDALILPVELSSFSAEETQPNTALLNWTTLTENNCFGFQIEKGVSGVFFDSIGFIPGNGTSSAIHTYSFTDDNFLTTSYYRLKQMDTNGKISYSDVNVISPNKEQLQTIVNIYPNPSTDYIHVSFQSNGTETHRIEITDMTGKCFTSMLIKDTNQREALLDVRNIPSGIYTLNVKTDNSCKTSLIEILR